MSPEDDQPPSGIDRGLELAFGDKQPKTKSQGDDEGLRSVELSPFLLARHEVTKGQWTRIWVDAAELRAPSANTPGDSNFVGGVFTAACPVEPVSWTMSRDLLRGHRLSRPTEAQWKHGCRGGTTSPWVVAKEELVRYANVADAAAQKEVTGWKCEPGTMITSCAPRSAASCPTALASSTCTATCRSIAEILITSTVPSAQATA